MQIDRLKPREVQRLPLGNSAKPPPAMNSRSRRMPSNKSSSSVSSSTAGLHGGDGLLLVLFHDHVGYASAGAILKRQQANKEIVKRALAPPRKRQFSWRWKFFRPTPSRLSTMSMAA